MLLLHNNCTGHLTWNNFVHFGFAFVLRWIFNLIAVYRGLQLSKKARINLVIEMNVAASSQHKWLLL